MENSVTLIIAAFLVIFTFIGILRKPLTCVCLLFVSMTLIKVLIPSIDSGLLVLVISGVITLFGSVAIFKVDRLATFFYGFVLTNFAFFHIMACVDSILVLTTSENVTFLSSVLNDELFLSTTLLSIIASSIVGGVFFVFNKRMVELLCSLIGTFIIVLYLIDFFRGGVSPTITFDSSLFSEFFTIIDSIVDKNTQIFTDILTTSNNLNYYIAPIISIVIAITTLIIKRNKYEYI